MLNIIESIRGGNDSFFSWDVTIQLFEILLKWNLQYVCEEEKWVSKNSFHLFIVFITDNQNWAWHVFKNFPCNASKVKKWFIRRIFLFCHYILLQSLLPFSVHCPRFLYLHEALGYFCIRTYLSNSCRWFENNVWYDRIFFICCFMEFFYNDNKQVQKFVKRMGLNRTYNYILILAPIWYHVKTCLKN